MTSAIGWRSTTACVRCARTTAPPCARWLRSMPRSPRREGCGMPRNGGDHLVLGDVERRVALRDIVGFDGLSDEALAAIARLSRRRELPAGSVLARAGEPRTHMVVLLAGDLEVVRMGRS